MLISIIVPCYNSEETIRECIESVLCQTFQNWEMLIVDDCSTDNSAEIAKKYADRYNKIRFFQTSKPSGSPALPRNIGIEHSSGNYIAFLDSDDIWLPNKLEHQVEFITSHHSELVYSYYEKMTWDGQRNNRIIKTRPFTTYLNLQKSNSIPCLTAVISREAIGETRFKNIPQEDFCFWLDILKKGIVAYNTKTLVACYRLSKNSRSQNKLAMFKGYWNVIRHEQKLGIVKSCANMVPYTLIGIYKHLK